MPAGLPRGGPALLPQCTVSAWTAAFTRPRTDERNSSCKEILKALEIQGLPLLYFSEVCWLFTNALSGTPQGHSLGCAHGGTGETDSSSLSPWGQPGPLVTWCSRQILSFFHG